MPRRTKIDTSTPGIHHSENGTFCLKPRSISSCSALPSSGWVAAVNAIASSDRKARPRYGLTIAQRRLMMIRLSNFFFRIQAEAHEHEHHERVKQAALHRPEDHFGQPEAHI